MPALKQTGEKSIATVISSWIGDQTITFCCVCALTERGGTTGTLDRSLQRKTSSFFHASFLAEEIINSSELNHQLSLQPGGTFQMKLNKVRALCLCRPSAVRLNLILKRKLNITDPAWTGPASCCQVRSS